MFFKNILNKLTGPFNILLELLYTKLKIVQINAL